MKFRKGKTYCCIRGCTNTFENTITTHFYQFPPDNDVHRERREKWIAAVRKSTPVRKDWTPSKTAKICSDHFIGGEKSMHPHKPAFVPSIFPNINTTVNQLRLENNQKIQTESTQSTESEEHWSYIKESTVAWGFLEQ